MLRGDGGAIRKTKVAPGRPMKRLLKQPKGRVLSEELGREKEGRRDESIYGCFSTVYELFLPFLVTKVIEDPV